MCLSSKLRREKFFENYNLKNEYSAEKIEELKKAIQEVIILITFFDKSELRFFNKSEFDNCKLSGLYLLSWCGKSFK